MNQISFAYASETDYSTRYPANAMQLESLNFKPLKESDFQLLHNWLNNPHLSGHWDGLKSLDAVKWKYSDKIRSDWQNAYIVSKDGNRFGYIQNYQATRAGGGWWPNELEGTFGIDQFIGESDYLDRGFGTIMVRSFSDWLLTQAQVTKVITEPSPANLRAIRCYEKAGFKKLEVIDTPDGKALLMEKVAG